MDIRQVTVSEVFDHPDAPAMLAGYAIASAIEGMPPPKPDRGSYERMGASGAAAVFAAFEGDRMVGVTMVLVTVNPHYSEVIGVTESIFVMPEHRKTGAGLGLLAAAEAFARSKGAVGFFVSAPVDGVFAEVMSRMNEYRESNRAFFKVL